MHLVGAFFNLIKFFTPIILISNFPNVRDLSVMYPIVQDDIRNGMHVYRWFLTICECPKVDISIEKDLLAIFQIAEDSHSGETIKKETKITHPGNIFKICFNLWEGFLTVMVVFHYLHKGKFENENYYY